MESIYFKISFIFFYILLIVLLFFISLMFVKQFLKSLFYYTTKQKAKKNAKPITNQFMIIRKQKI